MPTTMDNYVKLYKTAERRIELLNTGYSLTHCQKGFVTWPDDQSNSH